MKWFIRFVVCSVVYYSGAVALIRFIRRQLGRPRVVILAYHGVRGWGRFLEMFCEPELFERQMEFLAHNYDVVTVAELVRNGGKRLSRGLVAVTFDDGYEDNFAQAWPIAARHGLPLTIYVASGLVEAQCTTVVDALIRMFLAARSRILSIPELGLQTLGLQTDAEMERAVAAVEQRIRPLQFHEQQALLCQVAAKLQVAQSLWQTGMLTWAQVRQLSDGGNEIGAHSHSHAVLAKLSAENLDEELTRSKRLIAGCLGREPRHFAYPFGAREHISDAVVEAVGRHGYESAVVLYEGSVDLREPLRLRRFMVTRDRSADPWGRFSKAIFACELEGITRAILSLGRAT